MEIYSLPQLEKEIKPGSIFLITDHRCPERIGEYRVVTQLRKYGFYSKEKDCPDDTETFIPYRIPYGGGTFGWEFKNGKCSYYDCFRHDLVMEFKLIA